MDINIQKNKKKFEKWCKSYIVSEENTKNLDKFLKFLDESDFYTAPASSKFHLNCKGGLCQHTINVIKRMFEEGNSYYEENETKKLDVKEKMFLVAALHDLCKVNYYREITTENNETKKYVVDSKLPLGHGEKSLYIAQHYFSLSDEQAIAIRWHMGFSDQSVKGGSFEIGTAYSMYPLAVLLNIADIKATFFDESSIGGNKFDNKN